MSESRRDYLNNAPVWKILLNLSAPATIGMIVGALYNLVDTIFVGRGVGTLAISALTVVFPVQLIIMAIAQMIGIGGASIISRSLGSGDKKTAEEALGNVITMVFILSLLFMLILYFNIMSMLKLFGAKSEFIHLSRQYLEIVLFGNFFFTFTVALNNVVRAEGNAWMGMYTIMVGAGMNIVLDPVFIFLLKMGVRGAAWATVISQLIGFLFITGYFYTSRSTLKFNLGCLKLKKKIITEMLAIGSSAFVRQVAGSVIAIVINNSIAHYGGVLYIAVFGVIHRLLSFLFMPLFGIVQGLQPVVGFNYGAKNYKRVRKAVILATQWTTVVSVSGFLIIMLFPEFLLRVFSRDEILISKGISVMRITCLAIPVVGVQIVGSVMFMAIGKALEGFILSLSRQVLFFLPLVFILPMNLGISGIWAAFPVSDFFAFFLTLFLMIREYRKLDNLEKSLSH
ncbi:MAG: MATE family efflux transporter [Deltaproteobacteria bacterium]|nr:MATE family efflux transporter [Deltaproteobacteria bacterium]